MPENISIEAQAELLASVKALKIWLGTTQYMATKVQVAPFSNSKVTADHIYGAPD